MKKHELILVAGMSGAGKTIAMDFLEKSGYYCIDNLPIRALEQTIISLKKEENFFEYAIALNSNLSKKVIDNAINLLKDYTWLDVRVLFLDVSNEVLLERFQYTRKAHPFTYNNESIIEAIEQERIILENFKLYATIVIDTSMYKPKDLINQLEKKLDRKSSDNFRVSFVSFGYKHGIPRDVDFVFDVRFITNPFYLEELRHLTGNDRAVYDYVMSQNETSKFLELIKPVLDYSINMHQKSNRSYLVIGIGCTGGHHRSVTLVNYLSEYFHDKYNVIKDHRDEFR